MEKDVFLVHPQNGLNGLILNLCIGGCWFTPAWVIPTGENNQFQHNKKHNRASNGLTGNENCTKQNNWEPN